MASVTIPLSFTRPPLSLNQRDHWAKNAKAKREIRDEVFYRCMAAKIRRPARHVTVEFHWRPADRRRRDTDNVQPTVKSCCDALGPRSGTSAGYGLVPDDTPEFMARPEPIIHEPQGRANAACWLVLHIDYEETP